MAILKTVEDWRAQRSQHHHFHCYHHYYVTQESITQPSIITILFYQSIGCLGLLWWLSGKEPGFGRPPGGGHSNPLKYSCLENPMARGDWRAAVHGVIKSQKQLKWTRTHARTGCLSLGSLWNQRFFSFGDISLLATSSPSSPSHLEASRPDPWLNASTTTTQVGMKKQWLLKNILNCGEEQWTTW